MKIKNILIVIMAFFVSAIFVSCGSNTEYYNIAAENNVYSIGTQSILINSSSLNDDAPVAVFKSSISISDIELKEGLEGKKVTKVTYNSETSITIEVSGNTKVEVKEEQEGKITIKQSGLESKGNSSCYILVIAPELYVSSFRQSAIKKDGVVVYNIIATITLPVGEFIESSDTEGITLALEATGKLTTEFSKSSVTITIENCNIEKPTIKIAANTTTFGKEITIKLTPGGSASI